MSGLPRPRGDGPVAALNKVILPVAPPPTRGWPRGGVSRAGECVGSPCHAGMDPARAAHDLGVQGFPPTREWTQHPVRRPDRDSGFPAHAGMDPAVIRDRQPIRWLPRPRGDGPSASVAREIQEMAPPPTRGWTLRVPPHSGRAAGSPAHAGMDPSSATTSSCAQGFPAHAGMDPISVHLRMAKSFRLVQATPIKPTPTKAAVAGSGTLRLGLGPGGRSRLNWTVMEFMAPLLLA